MMIEERIAQLIERLQEADILLVEWESTLQIRLGYPKARDGSRSFLVPDEKLPVVRALAADCGLRPASSETLKPVYPCEFADGALRYVATSRPPLAYALQRRLVFAPLSWTGLRVEELAAIPPDGEPSPPPRTPRLNPPVSVPRHVRTVPLPAFCAALARIAVREKQHATLRKKIVGQLLCVSVYNLIDNSYEGDYEEIPPEDEPLSHKERQETDQAMSDIRQWSLRPEDEWVKEELIAIMTGKKSTYAFAVDAARRA